MSDYQYKSGAQWASVPDAAHPDDEGGQVTVNWPAPTDKDPNNQPCGGFGQPQILITANQMSGGGWDWYQDWFADEVIETATIRVTAFNPRRGAWVKYSGTLLRPQCQSVKPGATAARTMYSGVVITIQDITETT